MWVWACMNAYALWLAYVAQSRLLYDVSWFSVAILFIVFTMSAEVPFPASTT